MLSAVKLDLINQALSQGYNPDLRLKNLLKTVLDTFKTDRAWLLYPCSPDAPSYRIPKEVTTPQFPGALSENLTLPVTSLVSHLMQEALNSKKPIVFEPGHPILSELSVFQVQSQLMIHITPVIGSPWILGLHQCSYPRIWKSEEKVFLEKIAYRIADTLSNYLLFYEHEKNEEQYRTLFEFSHDGLIIINSGGNPLIANKSFCQLLGGCPRTNIQVSRLF